MKKTKSEVKTVHRDVFQKVDKGSRVALIYHFQVREAVAYNNWLRKSDDLLKSIAGKRLFAVSVDPVPREGMYVDEIIIDEYPSSEAALKFVVATRADLTDSCKNVTVLAIQPERPSKLQIVRKFILVYYPHRRNLLAMIESDEFKSGQHHRDAGLERVAIFMGSDKRAVAT